MRAERREALLDFLLEAVADDGAAAFPANVLAGMRRVVGCETVSFYEWTPQQVLEFSLAADEPEVVARVWDGYLQVRQDDPLAGGPRRATDQRSLPDRAWLGRALAISDFISDREFRSGGLYAEICKPLGVRAVMKVFLPTGAATGAELVFDTTRSRFTDSDRLILQRIVPHLGHLRRNAHARKDLPGAARFHRRRPGDAAAPVAMRTGRPGQGCGRGNQPRNRTSAFRQPRDRPQTPRAHLRQARSPQPGRSGRDLHPRASRHRQHGPDPASAQKPAWLKRSRAPVRGERQKPCRATTRHTDRPATRPTRREHRRPASRPKRRLHARLLPTARPLSEVGAGCRAWASEH